MANEKDIEFINSFCERCGAPIKIDPTAGSGVCPYCGSSYVTKKQDPPEEKISIQNIHNSEDIYNINYGKKGIVESALDFAHKRAESIEKVYLKKAEVREKAAAEAKAKAQLDEERRFVLEVEAKERTRIREEAAIANRKNFWRGVGLFFLWVYFFPVMLIVTIVKWRNSKKAITQGLNQGDAKPYKLPIGFIILGAIIWLPIIMSMFEAGGTAKSNSEPTELPEEAPIVSTMIAETEQDESAKVTEEEVPVITETDSETPDNNDQEPAPTVTLNPTPEPTPVTTPEPTPEPTPIPTPEPTPEPISFSNDEVIDTISSLVRTGYDKSEFSVDIENSMLIVSLYPKGTTANVYATKVQGDKDAIKGWNNLVSSTQKFSKNLSTEVHDKMGRDDLLVAIYLCDDTGSGNAFLVVMDGVVYYDVINEINLLGL